MVRLKPNQKIILTEKNSNAVYFMVVTSAKDGVLKMDIKGIMNVKSISKASMYVYDINRFCRYYDIHDFHFYYEERMAHQIITNKSTDKEMSFVDFVHMLETPRGYLMLRMKGCKTKDFTQEEYDYECNKYLNLMHLAVDMNNKPLYMEWYKTYKEIEQRQPKKEAK